MARTATILGGLGGLALLLLMGCAGAGGALAPTPAPTQGPGHFAPPGPYLRVLGIAQDGGLPHAACRCERCMAARSDPARASGVASLGLVVPASREVFLVDATPDITAQLAMLDAARVAPDGGVDRQPLDGVFLTHAHMGHYLGLAHLGFEAVSTREVPVWATATMVKFLTTHAPWEQLVRLGNIAPITLRPGKPVVVTERLQVIPYLVPHRAEYTDTVAYVFEGPERRVLYLPDTHPWHRWGTPMEALLTDVDVALLDGTFFSGDELPGRDLSKIGHPLIVDTMDRLQSRVDAGDLQVYFIHLNHSNPALEPSSQARRAIEARGFYVAHDGLDIAL